jgi:hypothetical protein
MTNIGKTSLHFMRTHKLIIIIMISIVSVMLYNSNGRALNIGIYGTGTVGGSCWSYKDYFYNGKNLAFLNSLQSRKTSIGLVNADGGGLLLDTDQIGGTIILYRLNAGLNYVFVGTPDKKSMIRFDITNTVGIRLYHNENFKVWIGPQLMLNYLWGRDTGYAYEIKIAGSALNNTGVILPSRYKRHYKLGGVNIGVAAGINYAVTDTFCVTVETGFRGNMYVYAGSMKTLSIFFLNNQFFYYSNPAASYSGYEGYLSCGILYGIKTK